MSNIKIRNLDGASDGQIVSGNYIPVALNTDEGQPQLTKKATFGQVVSGGITGYQGDIYSGNFTGLSVAGCDALHECMVGANSDLELQNGMIHISDGAVTSEAIAEGAVTSETIAPGAVTSESIAEGAIDSESLPVSPGGGLEFDENGNLKLATSSASLTVILRVNANTGLPLDPSNHVSRDTDGITVTDKFINMTDAYTWMYSNISSTRVNVSVIYETDTNEPPCGLRLISTVNKSIGQVDHYSEGTWNIRFGTLVSPTQIDLITINLPVDNSASGTSIFFDLSNPTRFIGLHFNFDLLSRGGEFHTIFRCAEKRLQFQYCKITLVGNAGTTTNRLIEIREGGSVYIWSEIPNSGVSGYEDPFSNGNRAHALEIDITGIDLVSNLFEADISSFLSFLDYRPGADTDLSGIHFTGNGTAKINNLFVLQSSSILRINTKFSRNSDCIVDCDQTIYAFAYNSIQINKYKEGTIEKYTTLPGNNSFSSSSSTPGDYVINVAFGASDATGPVSDNNLPTEADYF